MSNRVQMAISLLAFSQLKVESTPKVKTIAKSPIIWKTEGLVQVSCQHSLTKTIDDNDQYNVVCEVCGAIGLVYPNITWNRQTLLTDRICRHKFFKWVNPEEHCGDNVKCNNCGAYGQAKVGTKDDPKAT